VYDQSIIVIVFGNMSGLGTPS